MKRMLNQKLIDFLNSLEDSLKYESSTNTFELGTNLEVDGDITTNTGIINSPNGSIEISDDNFIYLNGRYEGVYISFGLGELDGAQNALTDKNTKTLFGKSILKERENNNIDLYKHYITLNAQYHCVIISSSNINCSSETGATQKLKDLLKFNNDILYYEMVYDDVSGNSGILYSNNNVLNIETNSQDIVITDIIDVVKTI